MNGAACVVLDVTDGFITFHATHVAACREFSLVDAAVVHCMLDKFAEYVLR